MATSTSERAIRLTQCQAPITLGLGKPLPYFNRTGDIHCPYMPIHMPRRREEVLRTNAMMAAMPAGISETRLRVTSLLVAFAALLMPSVVYSADRPNIVLVFIDDMGWGISRALAIAMHRLRISTGLQPKECDSSNSMLIHRFAPPRAQPFRQVNIRNAGGFLRI